MQPDPEHQCSVRLTGVSKTGLLNMDGGSPFISLPGLEFYQTLDCVIFNSHRNLLYFEVIGN